MVIKKSCFGRPIWLIICVCAPLHSPIHCVRMIAVGRRELRAMRLTAPESIGGLTELTTLHLEQNKLSALPETIGQLTKLTTLILSAPMPVVEAGRAQF